jgi:hypothetical protein
VIGEGLLHAAGSARLGVEEDLRRVAESVEAEVGGALGAVERSRKAARSRSLARCSRK